RRAPRTPDKRPKEAPAPIGQALAPPVPIEKPHVRTLPYQSPLISQKTADLFRSPLTSHPFGLAVKEEEELFDRGKPSFLMGFGVLGEGAPRVIRSLLPESHQVGMIAVSPSRRNVRHRRPSFHVHGCTLRLYRPQNVP